MFLRFLGNLKISKIHLEILFSSAFQIAWAGGRVDTLMSTWQLKYSISFIMWLSGTYVHTEIKRTVAKGKTKGFGKEYVSQRECLS